MKITRVESRQISLEDGASTLVFLGADNGLSGVGEASYPGSSETLRVAIEEVRSRIIGLDPFDANGLLTRLNPRGEKVSDMLLLVISGVQAACLDLVGKQLGVPVFQLFGGSLRDELRLCATHWEPRDDIPESYARIARDVANAGFTAIKLDPLGRGNGITGGQALERSVDITRSVREAVGTDIDLIVDANGRFTPAEAIYLAKALEPFNLMWLEDPIQSEDPDSLKKVANATRVPLAIGEHIAASYTFRAVIERQLADFVQLDCHRVGGILSARGIAVLAESYYIGLSLHHSGGPVALAMNAHLAACLPNFSMAEFPYPLRPSWNGVLRTPIDVQNGFLKLPCGPGLGVECRTELGSRTYAT